MESKMEKIRCAWKSSLEKSIKGIIDTFYVDQEKKPNYNCMKCDGFDESCPKYLVESKKYSN